MNDKQKLAVLTNLVDYAGLLVYKGYVNEIIHYAVDVALVYAATLDLDKELEERVLALDGANRMLLDESTDRQLTRDAAMRAIVSFADAIALRR